MMTALEARTVSYANTKSSLDIYMAKIEQAVSEATKKAKFHAFVSTTSDRIMREAISYLNGLGYSVAIRNNYFTIYWGNEKED